MSPATRNLTILLTDIKGFTDKTSHMTRAQVQALLDKHKELVLPALESKGGKLVKTMGDAFLMTFESPTDAVLAGVDVQRILREHNQGKSEAQRIEVRVAINQGEVNLSDNDVFGEPVNIAARVEAAADAGDVMFTDAVFLSMNKQEVACREAGLLKLKGIPQKVRVYKVSPPEPEPAAPADTIGLEKAGFAGAILVALAMVVFVVYALRAPAKPQQDAAPPPLIVSPAAPIRLGPAHAAPRKAVAKKKVDPAEEERRMEDGFGILRQLADDYCQSPRQYWLDSDIERYNRACNMIPENTHISVRIHQIDDMIGTGCRGQVAQILMHCKDHSDAMYETWKVLPHARIQMPRE